MAIFVLISSKRTEKLKTLLNKQQVDVNYVKENDLHTYINKNMNRIEHISHLIIDLYALVDTDNEIINTVETVRRIYNDMEIIVLADNASNRGKGFFRRLLDIQIYNIIATSPDNVEAFEEEIFYCIHEGKKKEDALLLEVIQEKNVVSEPKIINSNPVSEEVYSEKLKEQSSQKFENKTLIKRLTPNRSFKEYKEYLIVSVAGVNKHVGTTHNALLITKFLKDVGFKVCYLENGTENKIFTLKKYIPTINYNERINQMQLNRIDLYAGVSVNELLPYEYDIYVVDVGVLSKETMMSFLYKDVQILVCGGKSWEIEELSNAINMIKAKNAFHILFNFAMPEDEDKILQMIGEYKRQAYFTEYVPYFLEGDVNVKAYQGIFEKYLTVDEPLDNKPVIVKRKSGFINLMSRK